MKLQRKHLFFLLPVGVAGAALGVLAILNPTTHAQTVPDHDDARLRTRRYRASIEEVRAALEELIPALRCWGANWRLGAIEAYDASTPRASIIVRAEVPVTIFVDDVTITLRKAGEATLLDARSETRVQGKSDLGENRRHLAQLLLAMDEKFESV